MFSIAVNLLDDPFWDYSNQPGFCSSKSGKCRLSSCQLISWDGDPSATRNSEKETLSIGKQAISIY